LLEWLEYFLIALVMFGYVVIILILVLMVLAPFNKLRYRHFSFDDSYKPTFSLMVLAYNEESVIERTIQQFLKTDYPEDKKEVVIVNDGSKDKTGEIAAKYASKIIDAETGSIQLTFSGCKNVTLVNRKVGGKGKAYVANDGIKFASGEILFFIDADVRLTKNVFSRAARHFKDETVGAVAGYVSVFNKKEILNMFVDFESASAQKIVRLGYDTLGVHYIIPGGCAIFRKKVIDAVGGYQHDTLAEDTDITWRIATETDVAIHFDPSIVVVADEPTGLTGLWNQRVRWARGNFGVTLKHTYKIGRPRYHRAATYGYPFWLGNILAPLTFIFVSIALILNSLLNIDSSFISTFGRFLSFTFFFIVAAGIIVNRGRSWFGGLFAPGVPLLIYLFSNFFDPAGIIGVLDNSGYFYISRLVGYFFTFWLFFSVIGTWICLKMYKGHPHAAVFLQLALFGYWILLVSAVLYGYFKELRKEEMVWIRTER
jgi:cellulose synthase/poly-beta-1,6-N-acetylglucosamine synthase-like glycosyltransferase